MENMHDFNVMTATGGLEFDLDAIYGEAEDYLNSLITEPMTVRSYAGPDEVALVKGHSYRLRPYIDPSRKRVVKTTASHRCKDMIGACIGAGCKICQELTVVGNPRATHHQKRHVRTRMYVTIFDTDPKQATAWKGVPVILSGPESLYAEVQRVLAEIKRAEESGHTYGPWMDPTAEVPCLVIRYSTESELTVGYHWIKETMQPLPEDWPTLDTYHSLKPPTPEQIRKFQTAIWDAAYGKGKWDTAILDKAVFDD